MSDVTLPGVLGATRQRWQNTNLPEATLRDIMNTATNMRDRKRIRAEFCEAVEYDGLPRIVQLIVDYWFTNNYRNFLDSYDRQEKTSEQRHAEWKENMERSAQSVSLQAGKIRSAVKRKVDQGVKILLLRMIAPNGKPVCDCTFAECREMGGATAMQKFLTAIADLGEPQELVSARLSEAKARRYAPPEMLSPAPATPAPGE